MRKTCHITFMFSVAMLAVLLLSPVFESATAIDTSSFLLEGNHVNLLMPRESVGVNFTKILVDYESAKVCDAGYELLGETTGSVPFSGADINITGYGYAGEQNKPAWASMSGNPIRVAYDNTSSKNYILGYTPEDGNNSLPNFGIYFHEMLHDFTPSRFRTLFPQPNSTYGEGFARFYGAFINRLIIKNYQDYGLTSATATKMNSSTNWGLSFVRGLNPNNVNMSTSTYSLMQSFLQRISDDYQDYGKTVFTRFFKSINGTPHVIDYVPRNETDSNSLFIALINTATGSDYGSVFTYYRFSFDLSLYNFYMDRLKFLDDPSISIGGRVTNFYGTPISNVTVTAFDHLVGGPIGSAVTNESGVYSIPDQRPGLFTITAGKDGFAERNRSLRALTNSSYNSGNLFIMPGRFINLTISGNCSQIETRRMNFSGQEKIPYVTLVENQTESTTTFRMVTGEGSGNVGFVNVTIPKNNVTYGNVPTLYMNMTYVPSQSQNYAEDSANFYVWFDVQSGRTQASIVFGGASIPELPWSPLLTILVMLIMAPLLPILSRRVLDKS